MCTDLAQTLSNEFSEKATQVTREEEGLRPPTSPLYDGCIANSSQVP